jgi:hypothetical protein
MNIIKKTLAWWAKQKLIWQQLKNIETFSILENYITNEVLNGSKYKGNQLIDIQNKLDESKRFLKYLTKK